MARLYKGTKYTLVSNKYKISINTTLQPSIKILNKCSCVSKVTKWVSSPLPFVAIWSFYCLRRVFLRKSRDPPLSFPEPWFGFPTLVKTHPTTKAVFTFFIKVPHVCLCIMSIHYVYVLCIIHICLVRV